MTSFAERLRKLRAATGETQKQVAEVLEIDERNYRRYEAGQVDLVSPSLIILANHFNVSIDYLLGRSDNPTGHKGV
ncbi:MAG: helix-turn-helix domain-containing protein [Clostridiales bacterium]|nr:helix-turn-helix domain-containing protein [Clostridiales bacterium]